MWLSLGRSMGSGGKTPCMLDLITRWKLVVNTCSGLFKTMTKNRRYQLMVGKPISPKETLEGENVVSILKHVVQDMSAEFATLMFSVQVAAKTLDCLH
jgi:hypothetical protein